MRFLQYTGRIGIALLFGLGLSLSMLGTASAHAKVLDSIPAINSTIAQAPGAVTVHTAENINPDPKKSNLFVYGPAGELISQGNARVSLSNPKEMSVNIQPDARNSSGIYIVRWITVSALDGDPDEGAYTFTVNPKVGHTTSPTPIPNTPTTNSANTGVPLALTIGIAVIALLIGLGVGLVTSRRAARPKTSIATLRREINEQEEQQAPH
jgi:methionine-rich copper-binding protein CopC